MRRQQDGTAGCLVDAARLHADKAVLHQVEPANAVRPAELVQFGEQGRGRHRHAVDGDRVTLLETDFHIGRGIGRFLWRDGAGIDVFRCFFRRIFQHFAFRRDVQQVGVDRERRFAALVFRYGNLVRFGVFDQACAAGEVPFPPRCDDLDVGIQAVITELEANLIVALAGGAVRDRVGACLGGDLDLAFGDQRACDGGAQ